MSEVLNTAMRSAIDVESRDEWARIMVARLLVLFGIVLGWAVFLLGLLVLSAVHSS